MSGTLRLTVAELFPGHLMLNGDMGNVAVLAHRATLAGAIVDVIRIERGEKLPDRVDLLCIGSGPISAQRAIATDLPRLRAPLTEWIAEGVGMLAVNAGFHLLGLSVQFRDGNSIDGVGVLPVTTIATDTQIVTDEFVVDSAVGRLIGIENHATRVELHGGEPLGRVVRGVGNDGVSEGVRVNNALGTHLHGPVLAMNPSLADSMLTQAFARHGEHYELTAAHQKIDDVAHNAREHLARIARVPVDAP